MRERYFKNPIKLYLSKVKLDQLELYNVVACIIPNLLLIFSSPGNVYDYIIFYWEILLILMLLAIISNYMIFKAVKTKYIIEKEEKTIKDYIEPITNMEIIPFLWSFICGFIGLWLNFFYPLQLFTIF